MNDEYSNEVFGVQLHSDIKQSLDFFLPMYPYKWGHMVELTGEPI